MLEEFKNYVDKYDMNEKMIKLKYYHSLRVRSLSQLIAKYAGFNENDAKIAEVVGLLHDYGRFPQWEKYHTYKDRHSIDHADLAVDLLFKQNQIKNFWTKEEDYDEIYDAIKYHNKLEIADNLSEHNKTLCKIIRDADKLDNFYLLSENLIKEHETDEPLSEKVISQFKQNKLVTLTDVQNDNDEILAHLAFVFDLNYKYSFKHLHDYKIIDNYFEHIKNKEKFKPYFEIIRKYIEERMN